MINEHDITSTDGELEHILNNIGEHLDLQDNNAKRNRKFVPATAYNIEDHISSRIP